MFSTSLDQWLAIRPSVIMIDAVESLDHAFVVRDHDDGGVLFASSCRSKFITALPRSVLNAHGSVFFVPITT